MFGQPLAEFVVPEPRWRRRHRSAAISCSCMQSLHWRPLSVERRVDRRARVRRGADRCSVGCASHASSMRSDRGPVGRPAERAVHVGGAGRSRRLRERSRSESRMARRSTSLRSERRKISGRSEGEVRAAGVGSLVMLLRAVEVVLVVAAAAADGERDGDGGFAAAGAADALLVVEPGGRHVAEHDGGQRADVDAGFHRGGDARAGRSRRPRDFVAPGRGRRPGSAPGGPGPRRGRSGRSVPRSVRRKCPSPWSAFQA